MKYLSPSYDQMIQKSYGYDRQEQKNEKWGLMKTLYQNNYIGAKETQRKIPRIIHQIWLGPNPIPESYHRYMATWRDMHPEWEYHLWTDKDVKSVYIKRRDIFDRANNYGMKSDILRYELLKQYGGVYVDTDFECLKPFDDFLYLDFFTGIGYDRELQLYIGIMGSAPEQRVMQLTAGSLHTVYSDHKGSKIMNATGANHFTKCFLSSFNNDSKGVVAFPMEFFYPYPNNRRDSEDDPYQYVTPLTYAIHHWGISWIRKNK